jgi:hypothetical protein
MFILGQGRASLPIAEEQDHHPAMSLFIPGFQLQPLLQIPPGHFILLLPKITRQPL